MSGRNERRRRKSQSAAIYMPIAVLLIFFIGIFGTSVFLRVMDIEVKGESRYPTEEIISKSGITQGDNLLLIDTNSAVIKIQAEMPYISTIKIVRRWPDTVIIEIKESTASAVLSAQGSEWIIDADGRILERVSVEPRGVVRVLGVTPVEPKVGQKVSVAQNAEAKLEYMSAVLKAITEAGIHDKVTNLDVSNIANITFVYENRLTIAMGMAEDIRYKLDMMQEFVNKRPDLSSAVGTIDLSSDMYIFIPD